MLCYFKQIMKRCGVITNDEVKTQIVFQLIWGESYHGKLY